MAATWQRKWPRGELKTNFNFVPAWAAQHYYDGLIERGIAPLQLGISPVTLFALLGAWDRRLPHVQDQPMALVVRVAERRGLGESDPPDASIGLSYEHVDRCQRKRQILRFRAAERGGGAQWTGEPERRFGGRGGLDDRVAALKVSAANVSQSRIGPTMHD